MEVQPRYRENECLDSVRRKQEVREYLESVSGHDPRPAQIEATYQLLYGEHDVLLQAATGYGKSIIWQLTGLLSQQLICPSTVTIMISPLNSLTEQQVQNVETLKNQGYKVNAIAVTAKNNHSELYEEIARGEYTHGKHSYLRELEVFT
jgi:superfamily II DNA helicase RecQ